MINGLFETHLYVENLVASTSFYENELGLEKCYIDTERKATLFWIGKPKTAMLGIWEKPKLEIEKRHFAFSCDLDDILNKSVEFLKERNLQPYNFLKDGIERPMVFAWMPAISIYFTDPDGHYLEFIAILEGKARPELGVISYEEWKSLED
jgi:lactoylglutathione lyase